MIARKQGRLMLPVAVAALAALFAVAFYINTFNPTGFTAVRFDESTLKSVEESNHNTQSKTVASTSSTSSFSSLFSSHQNNNNHSSSSSDSQSSSFTANTPPGVLLVMEEDNESDLDILNQVAEGKITWPQPQHTDSASTTTDSTTTITANTTADSTSTTSTTSDTSTTITTTSDSSSTIATDTSSSSSSSSSSSFPSSTPFLEALETCSTLECLRDAHQQPRPQPTPFNFPHFIIIGFQKTATNALYKYLLSHPQVLAPATQEPDFFTYECQSRPPEYCPAGDVKKYLSKTLPRNKFIELDGDAATFEASTHIVRQGTLLAPRLRSLMPWLKIVICVREPITRAASMLVHNFDVHQKGCLQRKHISHCLLKESQISGALDGPTSYTEAIRPWLEEWPEEQIHLIQYEELQEESGELEELRRLKDFIGIEVEKPENARSGVGGGILGLRSSIARRSSSDSIQDTEEDFDDESNEGWGISREHYEELIDHVSPDVRGLMQLLEAHGKLKDRDAWLRRWQRVWDDTLASCDRTAQGSCSIIY